MGVNSISPAHLHVRPVGVHRTCRWAGEIKKNAHPKDFTALLRDQVWFNAAGDADQWEAYSVS